MEWSVNWWLLAFFGLFLVSLVAGYLGAALEFRTLRRILVELENDVISMNERLTRDQKVRAGVARQEQRSFEQQVIDEAGRSESGPKHPQMNLADWRKKHITKSG